MNLFPVMHNVYIGKPNDGAVLVSAHLVNQVNSWYSVLFDGFFVKEQ